ncbi:MAG: metallophosphoesterase family protein [Myxococcales bacterium]|nr:metallophosphatase family protein [Polyangiaceae bacterium]MDW8249812.1 metallophosphoesterase family protein [Myxococcales bacterium]
MRFLCLSDIHGHAEALQAVLVEAERRGFERVLVAGDLCFPGPAPLAVWKILMSVKATFVPGLTDRALATLDLNSIQARTPYEREQVERLRSTREELGELILARLARAPSTVRIPLQNADELLLVHGSPRDPTEGISHEMSDEELSAMLGDDPADVVVCGMTHVPFDRHVCGVRIINAGSVGEVPGGGFAQGTLLTVLPTGYEVESFAVPLARPAHGVAR